MGDGVTASKWAVWCECHTTKPTTDKAVAERQCAQVEESGHCMFPHEVVEVQQ